MTSKYRKMRFLLSGVEYEILFDFTDETTGHSFIVYTDYSINRCYQTKLLASMYYAEDTKLTLKPIESEHDRQTVEREINKFISDTQ